MRLCDVAGAFQTRRSAAAEVTTRSRSPPKICRTPQPHVDQVQASRHAATSRPRILDPATNLKIDLEVDFGPSRYALQLSPQTCVLQALITIHLRATELSWRISLILVKLIREVVRVSPLMRASVLHVLTTSTIVLSYSPKPVYSNDHGVGAALQILEAAV